MPIKKNRPKKTKVPGIWQDGEDRFLVRARWTDPKTMKRMKREDVAESYEGALKLLAELRGAAPEAATIRQRFSDYVEQWMREHGNELAATTRERYIAELARIVTVLGEHFVDAIDEADVRRWRDALAKEVAHSTVNAHLRTLRVVLEPLVRRGVLNRNPARDVPALKEGRTKGARGRALDAEQLGALIDATRELMGDAFGEDLGRMILVLAWTGMRRGELLALKWEDYANGELHVCRALCKTTRTEKTTKTDDPRLVPVAEPLARILYEQRAWLVRTEHPGLACGLMFPADPGHAKAGLTRRKLDEMCWYRSGSCLDKPLRAVVDKAKIPKISLHSFRRTYENLLRRAGVNDLVRRSLAGWRTEQAQAIYADVDREERRAASSRMQALVEGTPAGTPGSQSTGPRTRRERQARGLSVVSEWAQLDLNQRLPPCEDGTLTS